MIDRVEALLLAFMIYVSFELNLLVAWARFSPWSSHRRVQLAKGLRWVPTLSTVLMGLVALDLGIDQDWYPILLGVVFTIAAIALPFVLGPVLKLAKTARHPLI